MISLAQIPEELRHVHMKKEFLSHVRQLPAHRNDKKQLLFAWAKMVGTILTPSDVDYATLPYGGAHGFS
jgi:hypothetical protein